MGPRRKCIVTKSKMVGLIERTYVASYTHNLLFVYISFGAEYSYGTLGSHLSVFIQRRRSGPESGGGGYRSVPESGYKLKEWTGNREE